MEAFFGRDVKEKASLIDDLLTAFSATEVVSTQDIFRRVLVGTGFHGESRILRYLFIEWASDYLVSNSTAKRLREDLDNSRGDPTCQYRLELIKYMERKFVSRARECGNGFRVESGYLHGMLPRPRYLLREAREDRQSLEAMARPAGPERIPGGDAYISGDSPACAQPGSARLRQQCA
jgi:hypothetical protein